MQLPRGAVAERGARPRGEDGCQILALRRELGLPDDVDAAIATVQRTARDAFGDGARVEAERVELPDGDQGVLAGGDRGDSRGRVPLQRRVWQLQGHTSDDLAARCDETTPIRDLTVQTLARINDKVGANERRHDVIEV